MRVRPQISRSGGGSLTLRSPVPIAAAGTCVLYTPENVVITTLTPSIGAAIAWLITAIDVDDPKILTTTEEASPPIVGENWLLWYGSRALRQSIFINTISYLGAGVGYRIYLRDAPDGDPLLSGSAYGVLSRATISAAITSTVSSALDYGQNYRAEWRDSDDVVFAETLFDICRTPAKSPATAAGFRSFRPTLASEFDTSITNKHTFEEMIGNSFAAVFADLESQTLDAYADSDLSYALVDWTQCETLVYLRFLLDQSTWLIPKDWADDPVIYHQLCKADYKEAFQAFKQNIRWIDRSQERDTHEDKSISTMTILL